MEQGNEVFGKDYADLQEKLSFYPGISLISVDKDPPEQYVIEYRLFGYGYDQEGQVQMLRRHRIEINLPFGYPHFPPTVKPLTRICHPDVAEHTIRIADFWQTTPSLADLVIHIGDMIRGAVYSTEGAFNEEALEWYVEHQHKLPLAELDYRDPNAKLEETQAKSPFPLRLIAGGGLVALLLAGTGLVVRDKMILSASDETEPQMKDCIESRKFQEAENTGRTAVDALQKVILFQSASNARLAEIITLLESDRLQEGLAGRIQYKGRFLPIEVVDTLAETDRLREAAEAKLAQGDTEAASTLFSSAIKVAEKSGLNEAAETLRRVSAEKRLTYYVDKANADYSDGQWSKAAELYGLAVTILENEQTSLSNESLDTREKLEKLKTLAQANIFKEEAVDMEKTEKYVVAADKYRDIVLLIQQSGYNSDPVMAKVGSDAEAERQRVADLALVVEGTGYLLDNFKKIFMEHYPGLFEPGLQSPRVRYLGRTDGNLLFIISCIELVKRHTSEFRLNYQFDPGTRKWSIYREGQ